MAYTGGTMAAVTAATAKRRQDQQEEEEMTPYTSEDLEQNWEFKIVRSTLEAFGKPEVLRRLMEEEARAGWVLVEKFDNARVRFKRPASARQRDMLLPPGVDPYRTTYGIGSGLLALVVIGVVGLAVLVALLATFFIVGLR